MSAISEELFVRCCAPTLAGLKTGSMYCCDYEDEAKLTAELRQMNRLLTPRGMRFVKLRCHDGRALLYLFRPERLKQDMENCEARKLLDEAGYADMNCNQCICRLIRRLQESESFPHEIGLFLSYPPEDVRGFIENRAQNYKLTGYWKVYGDEQKARRTFDQYTKCTASYCKRLKAGHPLSELAVAV